MLLAKAISDHKFASKREWSGHFFLQLTNELNRKLKIRFSLETIYKKNKLGAIFELKMLYRL